MWTIGPKRTRQVKGINERLSKCNARSECVGLPEGKGNDVVGKFRRQTLYPVWNAARISYVPTAA